MHTSTYHRIQRTAKIRGRGSQHDQILLRVFNSNAHIQSTLLWVKKKITEKETTPFGYPQQSLFLNKEQNQTELGEKKSFSNIKQKENARRLLTQIPIGNRRWNTTDQWEPSSCMPCGPTPNQEPPSYQHTLPSIDLPLLWLVPQLERSRLQWYLSAKGKLFSSLPFCSALTDC